MWAQKPNSIKAGYDLVYACPDTNPHHSIHVTFHYHIRLHPFTLIQHAACKTTITPRMIHWDCRNAGFPIVGDINRLTEKVREVVGGVVVKNLQCHTERNF